MWPEKAPPLAPDFFRRFRVPLYRQHLKTDASPHGVFMCEGIAESIKGTGGGLDWGCRTFTLNFDTSTSAVFDTTSPWYTNAETAQPWVYNRKEHILGGYKCKKQDYEGRYLEWSPKTEVEFCAKA